MRQLDFVKFWQQAMAAVFVFTLLIIAACGEDEPKVDPVTVEFTSTAQTITEDGGVKNITLSLSSAAKKNGTITLSASPANANTFATFPTEITITKGSTSAQFALTPINNAIIDASAKVITFTLDDATSGFELGEQLTHAVTITDDEGPTTANFTVASGTVAENAGAGIVVAITLSPAAEVAGTIEVTMTPTDAAVTTTPTATAGVLNVPVAIGQTSVSFTVVPQNNTADNDDLEIDFEITDATGGVIVGTNVDYTLTVDDDDDIVPVPIADIRAMYTSSDVTINTETYIEGVVISSGSNVTNRNVFIQDATGSIVVRFEAAHSFVQGDKLLINLNGALLTRDAGSGNTGPLQLGGTAGIDAATKATKTGTGTVPGAETITVAQLNAGTYEGKLVKVENVFFPDADGLLKLNGSRTLSNGTITTIVRSESYSPWQNSAIPLGSGAVEGIASIFNGAAQLIPLEASDIFANNPVGTIGITGTLTDFGSVNNGAESAEQSYTVQGTTLTNDLMVTASGGFKVSLTSGSGYGSSATILAASANIPTTVYVKFTPTSGANQVINGTITHKSQGAASVVVNVSGTETGNSATNLLLNEHFNYSLGQLTAVGGGANVSAGKWTNFSGTTNVLSTVSGNLSYTNYTTAEGAKVSMINGSAEDAYTAFTQAVTTGKVYVAFLVNIKSTTGMQANTSTTGDYFAGVLPSTNTTALVARVTVRAGTVPDTYNFGLRATSSNAAAVFAPSDYAINQTHLAVISYEIVDGATNDVMNIWIDPDFSGAEPAATLTQTGAAGDLADVARFFLRQGTNAVNADVDGIRAALTWNDLFD